MLHIRATHVFFHMFQDKKLVEKRILKRPLYTGVSVNFCADRVRLPNGKSALREYLDHPGAVAVLGIIDSRYVIMVRQYRYPVGEITWEIPAGKLRHKKDDPLKRARRELLEETGYSARALSHLITYWPCPAFSNELLRIYLASNLRAGDSCPDEDEFVECALIPLSRAYAWVMSGKIKDSKTVLALLTYRLRKK